MEQENELWAAIKKHGFETRMTGYRNQEDAQKGIYTHQYWSLPMENEKLEQGDFFYKEKYDFIHFTNLDAATAILNAGTLRLYNLVNMDDRYELEYGLKELNFPENDKFKKDKEQLFCLSMCSYPEINDDETSEHLLWRLYGNNGYGVMLRLKLANDPKNWYQYHLSRVFYNTENMEAVKKLHSQPGNKIFLDPKISGFFKSPVYSFEKEVRLVFDKREDVSVTYTGENDVLIYPIIHPDKLKQDRNVFYFELPLYNFYSHNADLYRAPNVEDRMDFEIPKIYLAEIILGYRYTLNELQNINKKIKDIAPGINVRMTRMKKYF